MPEVITEEGSMELPYDVKNPGRLKAAVEMLLEEMPEEMKPGFMDFWQQAYQPVMDEDPIVEEPMGPMEVTGGEVPA